MNEYLLTREEITELAEALDLLGKCPLPMKLAEEVAKAQIRKLLEELEKRSIKGKIEARKVGPYDESGHTDNYDLIFSGPGIEICLNGAEELVYGKQDSYIVEPKKGRLVFMEEREC